MKDVIVFTTWDEPIADMALNFLRDAGIPDPFDEPRAPPPSTARASTSVTNSA